MLNGFSKYNKVEKRSAILSATSPGNDFMDILNAFESSNEKFQDIIESLSENVLGNHHLPWSIAPNFIINGQEYHIPFVIEESSVVAAAAWAARFWSDKGGFKTNILGTKKSGQVYFKTNYPEIIKNNCDELIMKFREADKIITRKMQLRGGGIQNFNFELPSIDISDVCVLNVEFETVNSMGANFINSCLETYANVLKNEFADKIEIVMSILSNYTPECMVDCYLDCNLENLSNIFPGMSGEEFANKMMLAISIANNDIRRAVTHNKGIYNGVSAVALATSNDFRAIEASGHAYAASSGRYKSLSYATIEGDTFSFGIKLPLAVGTVGGLTKLHPMTNLAFRIMQNPDSRELMSIMASAGLANHFSALKALVTGGIQQGHMKMHLSNILKSLQATSEESNFVRHYFSDKVVSYAAIEEYLNNLRK